MTMAYKISFALFIILFSILTNISSGEILLQTGFENDVAGKIPSEPANAWQASGGGFEVSSDIVKEGKKSLGVIGGAGDQALGAIFKTKSAVISAEFWLYVDGVDRSLTVFVQDPNVALTDWGNSGPYINWIADGVRHYPGAWEDIGKFSSKQWHYVRLVVDVGKASHDIYIADSALKAHKEKPVKKGLGFRTAITPPPGKVLFGTYGQVAPAYVDDLLIYEGDVLPEGIFAVTPGRKLPVIWGLLKK